MQGCTALRELRLNHNALTALPQGLSACKQLRIVDVAGNPIAALQPIMASHSALPCQYMLPQCHLTLQPV